MEYGEISKYENAIETGAEITGEWIKKWYKYILDGLKNKLFFYDDVKAKRAVSFIETFCHHSKGMSGIIKLELWQKALISVLFGVVGADGYRQFREVVIIIGKKNGKSLLASAISTYMLFADGEMGPDCICIAPLLQQSSYVFNDIMADIQLEPELAKKTKSTRSGWKIPETFGSIQQIAFNEEQTDGMNPHIAVLDEMAAWAGASGLKQYQVIKSSLGARKQAMMLSITTAGYVDDGVYDDVLKRAIALLSGNSTETRFAPFIYMIDDVQRWDDLNEIKKANPNLGVSIPEDIIKEDIAAAKISPASMAEFLCKRCNVKQNSSTAWLRAEEVEKCFGKITLNGKTYHHLQADMFKHCYCVGGIDLSKSGDLTSACLAIQVHDEIYGLCHFWIPRNKLQECIKRDRLPYDIYMQRGFLSLSGDNNINSDDCEQWFDQMISEFELLPIYVGYDKWMARTLSDSMRGKGYHMDWVNQGFNLNAVIREMDGLIRDGHIHFGDNDLMKIHLLETTLVRDTKKDLFMIGKINENKHIDGVAAFLDAMTVRQKNWANSGQQLRNDGYEQLGKEVDDGTL